MIALPLQVTKLYHQFKGVVMPHELLDAVEVHLAGPETSLDNRDDWGLVQKWILGTAQEDSSNLTSKSFLAFRTDTLWSSDDLIHRWIDDCLDATLGRHPNETIARTTVGMQGNMVAVHNMFGIIATKVGCPLKNQFLIWQNLLYLLIQFIVSKYKNILFNMYMVSYVK